jgi:hypothetical protein
MDAVAAHIYLAAIAVVVALAWGTAWALIPLAVGLTVAWI